MAFCRNCGAQVDKTMEYCPNCGIRQTSETGEDLRLAAPAAQDPAAAPAPDTTGPAQPEQLTFAPQPDEAEQLTFAPDPDRNWQQPPDARPIYEQAANCPQPEQPACQQEPARPKTGQTAYGAPARQQGYTATSKNDDKNSWLWGILGFFVPIAGLILFLIWKNDKPKSGKAAGIGALVSVILGVVLYVLAIAFLVVISAGIGDAISGLRYIG